MSIKQTAVRRSREAVQLHGLIATLFKVNTMARKITKGALSGGNGGSAWDDDILAHSPAIVGVRSIAIRHGNQVDSLQVTYLLADGSSYTASKHGGGGGTPSSFTLAGDERIIRVEGKTNHTLVDQVTFITKNAAGIEKRYGPYGKTGKTAFSIDGYVVGFYGRAGNLLDALGVYYLPPLTKSALYGGDGGNAFADPVETNIPPVVNIKRMRIRHGNQVDSIDADYELLGGGVLDGTNHGGSGGRPTDVSFVEGELIEQMSGRTNNTLVDQITFTTRKPDGSTGKYGPFGKTGRTEFQVDGRIVGFFGRSGNLLDALGVFYV